MESRIVGTIKPVDYDPDFFESDPYPIPYFDNKELKVCFIDARHKAYLLKADDVLQNFLRLDIQDRLGDSAVVFRYYREMLKYGYTKPLAIKAATDIWKFVHPSEIILHCEANGDFYLCVSCGCAWEEEHGLQLVFKNGGRLTSAGGHDGGFGGE